MAFVNKASAADKYSSDEESDEMYEDQYATQIGKSVKCTQFINNTKVTTKGQAQTYAKQGQAKQGQAKQMQVQKQLQVQKQKLVKQLNQQPHTQVTHTQVTHTQVIANQDQIKQNPQLHVQNTAREVVDDWEDLM
jgi:hypothetical protein